MSEAKSGHVAVIGLGPGSAAQVTPEASEAVAAAKWFYGYGPYVDRLELRPDQVKVASDNREEISRAQAALAKAAEGERVAVVSGGDPGVFAMAAAVCEAIEAGPAEWRALDVTMVPGVTAMLAVAARIGAPLGHDFCAISLSDNLKPWELIEKRLDAVASAGFVIALYNPISKARPWQLGKAFERLAKILPTTTPVIFGRAAGRPGREDRGDAARRGGRGAGGHGDLRDHRLGGDAHHRARRQAGAGLYAALFGSWRQRMIGEAQDLLDARAGRHVRQRRTADEKDLDAERARGGDLAVGRLPAAVLGDDRVDAVCFEQRAVVGLGKGSAREDVGRMRHAERRLDRIDAADEIGVLRRGLEGREFLAAEREKDFSRGVAERRRRLRQHRRPSVQRSPGCLLPGGAAQCDSGNAGEARGLARRWRRFARHRDGWRRSGGRCGCPSR